jgi:hypothetical protein
MSEIEAVVNKYQLNRRIKLMISLGFVLSIFSVLGFAMQVYDLSYFLKQYQKGKVEMFWYRWLQVPIVSITFISITIWIKLTFNLHHQFQKEKQ